MSKPDVWMPLYPADLLADTSHLSREDFGSYVLLICAYWRRGEALPDDDQALRRICRCDADHWPEARKTLAEFFATEGGVWRHKRIEHELQNAKTMKARQRDRTEKARLARLGSVTDNVTRNVTDIVTTSPSPSPSSSSVPTDVGTKTPYTGGDVEQKLPATFPKDEQDAIARCMTAGVPDEFIKDVYHKALSRGGKDAREIPIAVWPSYVKTEWKYEQNRKQEKDRKPAQHHQHRPEGIQPRML